MKWMVFDSGSASALVNMAIDTELLAKLDVTPVLHFYEWESDAATYGYFINPAEYLNLHAADRLGLQLAKRSTGGGIVFHVCDFAFSVLVPASYKGYSLNKSFYYVLTSFIRTNSIQLTKFIRNIKFW